MSLIDMSAAEAISRTLNSAPNSRIDPRLWLELSRAHSAIKEMAALTDAISNPPGGTYNDVPVNMYLQEQTVVTARAGQALFAYRPVRLILDGGELKAFHPCYSSAPTIFTRADAVTTAAVASGAMGEFILRGIAFAEAAAVTSVYLDTFKSRMFAAGATGSSPDHWFTGSAGSSGSTLANRDYAVAGTFLHAYGASGSFILCLMYFNPERTWIDKGYTS
jgi:hypothetical protein